MNRGGPNKRYASRCSLWARVDERRVIIEEESISFPVRLICQSSLKNVLERRLRNFWDYPSWRRESPRRGQPLLSNPPQAESLETKRPVTVQVESRLEAGSPRTGQKFGSESERIIFQ